MQIQIKPISSEQLEQYLAIPDLTLEPDDGRQPHAVRLAYLKIEEAIKKLWPETEIRVIKESPIVTKEDCYDNLLVPKNNITRSSTYTQYVDLEHCLQSHTSAQIPGGLRKLAKDYDGWEDVTLIVPGLAYRRDIKDRTHLGVLHQIDVWRIVKNEARGVLTKDDLLDMVRAISDALAPGWDLRIVDNPHPYTNEGIEVNATHPDGRDIEILECGLLGKDIIKLNGMDPEKVSGLASGPGLDRLVMTLKDLPDIRYLRSDNPRIAGQMHDLEKYKPVSLQPEIKRDMSYSVPKEYVEEDISQDIEAAIGEQSGSLESVELLSATDYSDLNDIARKKLGTKKDQKNVLVRVTLRNLNRSITNDEANQIYKDIYAKVNYGEGGYEE